MDQGLAESGVSPPPPLPAPSPIAMPPQPLGRPPRRGTRRVLGARLGLAALVASGTVAFAWTLYKVLSVQSPTPLQLVFWVACTVCFVWIAIGAASAVIGFVVLMSEGSSGDPDFELPASGSARTALLFPVYSESPHEVAAAIDAVRADLAARDASSLFDIFVLSDTQDEEARRVERMVYSGLAETQAGRANVYVRWRTPNTARKAGNIREWITTYGGAYRYFVIFDADSIMSGASLLSLVAAMEREPDLGLLQSVPRLVGARTLFARAQQFAAAYYGPIVATGLATWQGDCGNYWGHNAIIRTQAFATSAGLPELAGRPPLGGHILSHDFVEAALLARAGWKVRLLPHLAGSYEGCPPTLGDLLKRDRRWAQGNLQHLKILHAWRLAAISRVHLALGAWSYLASPVWAATLLIGMVLSFEAKFANPKYFGTEVSLFPKWPVFDAEKALVLFVATLVVVHLPKILGIVWAMRSRQSRPHAGNPARVVGGALFESIMAALVAPILMLGQTSAVLSILSGRDSGWIAQRRSVSENTVRTDARWLRWHIMIGVAGGAICAAISWQTLACMLPIFLGLVGAAHISFVTALSAPAWIAHLLATPEDLHPPAIVGLQSDCLKARQDEKSVVGSW